MRDDSDLDQSCGCGSGQKWFDYWIYFRESWQNPLINWTYGGKDKVWDLRNVVNRGAIYWAWEAGREWGRWNGKQGIKAKYTTTFGCLLYFTFFIPPSDYILGLPTMAPSSIIFNNLCLFPGGSDGKASAYNAGNRNLIPGLGRSPGEGNGNPLQYPCLENPMDGGAWRATVYGIAESDMTEQLLFLPSFLLFFLPSFTSRL